MDLTLITSEKQYIQYCNLLEKWGENSSTKKIQKKIEVLELIIEKYNETHFEAKHNDPISFLKDLMDTHGLSQQKLADDLGISKGAMSLILNYKRGLSKDIIRKLSKKFKMRHEAFNRPYELQIEVAKVDSGVMNTEKEMVLAM